MFSFGGLSYGIRKKMEEETERSPLLKALIESMPEMIFIFDKDGKLKYLNKRMKEFLKENPHVSFSSKGSKDVFCDYSIMEEKCKGSSMCEYCFLQKAISEIKDYGKPVYNREGTLHINIEGENKKISIIQNIYPFDYGGGSYVIFSFRDIEDIRRYERRRIKNMKKLSIIGESVSTIVHDLKNPLTGLLGYIELMKLKGYEEDMINRMEGALERIRTMLEDILSLTSGDDEIILNKEWLDLREIVLEVVRLLDVEEETHIDIRGKTQIYIDKVKIHNVIWNVVKNAVEAIDKENGEIDIKIYKKNKIMNLEIKDNGKGIKKENQEDIFKPGKTFDKHNGTGFGLASARRTIKAHEGTIDFASLEGEGTTFFIKIPINS